MTKEEAQFISKMCESSSTTWTKLHIEYQKQFVDPSLWYQSPSGYQKDMPLPHGNQIDGSELCKEAEKILNKI
jgi:hypothetical protein